MKKEGGRQEGKKDAESAPHNNSPTYYSSSSQASQSRIDCYFVWFNMNVHALGNVQINT